MKKVAMLGAAIAVVVACSAAGYVSACDKETKSASTVAASTQDAKTVKAVAGGSCAAKKASYTTASSSGCGSHAKMSTVAAGGAECASKTKSASLAKSGAHCGTDAKSANAKMADCGDCADFVFTVADMSGDCCTGKIESALASLKNVHGVWVDSETKKAYVCASATKKVDTKSALKSLKKAGFKQAKYVGIDTEHTAHTAS